MPRTRTEPKRPHRIATLPKTKTGIDGLDNITKGGLPRGRPTLVCGSAGCGKTLFAMQFLVNGAERYGEPGVFIAFEETPEELGRNVASLGFDLDSLVAKKRLFIDYVHVDRREIEEAGEYDLEGLFVRLGHAIRTVGAKRVVLDTLETLFIGFGNDAILRGEIRRLFRWLKDQGVTSIVTAESGQNGHLTRRGLEEYVSDCVIALEHRTIDQLATRRLRVVKYRGSSHGTNDYPFLIDEHGISVFPITAIGLEYGASTDRVSSGIRALDDMLGGKGYYRGSSVLVSGAAGTGKSSVAAHFVDAACARGERCVYLALEESADQIARNMRSIGIDLAKWIKKGLLTVQAARPTLFSLEMHLVEMHKLIQRVEPTAVVIDPISSFMTAGDPHDVKAMLVRLLDYLKTNQITSVFTLLSDGAVEETDIGVSSLIDTWLLVRDLESAGERNRAMYVIKSRGMAHSNQVREFLITQRGISLIDVYTGRGGGLAGSARLAQVAIDASDAAARRDEASRRARLLERRRRAVEAQIELLRTELAEEEEEAEATDAAEVRQEEGRIEERAAWTTARAARGPRANGAKERRS